MNIWTEMNDLCDSDFRAVADFIERVTKYPKERVSMDTTLLQDVGIDGEDAEEFFVEFGRSFSVALDELDLSLHFGGEGYPGGTILALPLLLILRILGREARKPDGLKPISVSTLVKAVKTKRWIAQ